MGHETAKPAIGKAAAICGSVIDGATRAYAAYDRAHLAMMSAERREAELKARVRRSLMQQIWEEERMLLDKRFKFRFLLILFGGPLACTLLAQCYATDIWAVGFYALIICFFCGMPISYVWARLSVTANPTPNIARLRRELSSI